MLWTRGIDKPRMGNLIATICRDYPGSSRSIGNPNSSPAGKRKRRAATSRVPVSGPGSGFPSLRFRCCRKSSTTTGRASITPAALAAVEAANADKHIASFIASFPNAAADGRSPETLRARSPKSFSTLQRSANMPESLTEEAGRAMMRDIADIYYLIIDNLPYEAQVADARFRAAEIGRLREQPQACADFIRNPRIFLRQSRKHRRYFA